MVRRSTSALRQRVFVLCQRRFAYVSIPHAPFAFRARCPLTAAFNARGEQRRGAAGGHQPGSPATPDLNWRSCPTGPGGTALAPTAPCFTSCASAPTCLRRTRASAMCSCTRGRNMAGASAAPTSTSRWSRRWRRRGRCARAWASRLLTQTSAVRSPWKTERGRLCNCSN